MIPICQWRSSPLLTVELVSGARRWAQQSMTHEHSTMPVVSTLAFHRFGKTLELASFTEKRGWLVFAYRSRGTLVQALALARGLGWLADAADEVCPQK